MQGALRPFEGGREHDEPPRDGQLAGRLGHAISASDGAVVRCARRIYGQDYAGGPTAVDSVRAGWLAQLNTDPRRRIAAGTAIWAVAVEQEDLADRAWQQLADHGLRPATAADSQLAAQVSGALIDRHASASGAGVSAALARLARPGGPLSPAGTGAASLPMGARRSSGLSAASAKSPPAATGERFPPTFDEPAYTYLRAIAPEWLLPGSADIPEDSIVVLRTNPAFAEAFLVGLNHALARELIWRHYPLEQTATMFSRFWGAARDAQQSPPPALADWPPDSALGSHSTSAEQLVLLVRGQLLRRFPTAVIYLSRTDAGGSETRQHPTLAATLAPGTMFFGFPLTPDDVAAASTGPAATATWSIVIQEAVDHPRFGCDDPPEDGTSTALETWQDLDWAHPHLQRTHLQGAQHVRVAGPLAGITRALAKDASPVAVASATWGLDAGQLAAILQQPAFRIRIPVSLWLSPPTG